MFWFGLRFFSSDSLSVLLEFCFKSVLKQTLPKSLRNLNWNGKLTPVQSVQPLNYTKSPLSSWKKKEENYISGSHAWSRRKNPTFCQTLSKGFPFSSLFLWFLPLCLPEPIFQLTTWAHSAQKLPCYWMCPCLSTAGEKTVKLNSKATREAAASSSHGNNNFYRLEAEISEGNNPDCHSQVREGGPNGTGLSFKAKHYCRRAWTWLYYPLKGDNNDSHIPARGNKAKQEFCLHKM